jgi:hypothetical protein
MASPNLGGKAVRRIALLAGAVLLPCLLTARLWGEEPPATRGAPAVAASSREATEKPALVVSFSGYQTTIDDLDQLGGGQGGQAGQEQQGAGGAG